MLKLDLLQLSKRSLVPPAGTPTPGDSTAVPSGTEPPPLPRAAPRRDPRPAPPAPTARPLRALRPRRRS